MRRSGVPPPVKLSQRLPTGTRLPHPRITLMRCRTFGYGPLAALLVCLAWSPIGKADGDADSIADEYPAEPAGQMTAPQPRQRGAYEYCGKIRLPGPIGKRRSIYEKLRDKRAEWESELRKYERVLRALVAGTPARGAPHATASPSEDAAERANERKMELRCALNWAAVRTGEVNQVRNGIQHDLESARRRLMALEERAEAACGPDPVSAHPTQGRAAKNQWNYCMRPYRNQLNFTRREVHELERDLRAAW
jgi:hypothetical protein